MTAMKSHFMTAGGVKRCSFNRSGTNSQRTSPVSESHTIYNAGRDVGSGNMSDQYLSKRPITNPHIHSDYVVRSTSGGFNNPANVLKHLMTLLIEVGGNYSCVWIRSRDRA